MVTPQIDWVNRAIVSRLTTRFTLSESPLIPRPYSLSRIIVPVTNFDQLLKTPKLAAVTINIGTAGANAFTVPAGKRWLIYFIYREATVNAVQIAISDGTASVILQAITVGPTFNQFHAGVPMDQNWTIIVSQGAVGDTAIDVRIIYEEEDAY